MPRNVPAKRPTFMQDLPRPNTSAVGALVFAAESARLAHTYISSRVYPDMMTTDARASCPAERNGSRNRPAAISGTTNLYARSIFASPNSAMLATASTTKTIATPENMASPMPPEDANGSADV